LLGLARIRSRLAGVATGAAAGVVTGAGSVLLAVCAGRLDRPGDLLLSIAPYATVVVGLLGLLLSQVAFQTGDIGAPLASLSVLEPATAVVLAVTVLHERLPSRQLTRSPWRGSVPRSRCSAPSCSPAPRPSGTRSATRPRCERDGNSRRSTGTSE
ncbi:MAG: hypothetical protein QOJ32_3315, partial [Frankiaceae bacterium]|nr:hypothetical protein [Frankiaceae bacterium]